MIRSNRELLYDSRNNRSAIIELEIKDWSYNSQSNSYQAVVIDYAVLENEARIQINQKTVNYPAEQIDNLFNVLDKSITPNVDNFTDKLKDLISDSLLYITVTDTSPVYGSTAEDWIKVESIELTE